jgi:hypothetical protein
VRTVSEQALSIWAKSGEGADWHPLIAHMLDTAGRYKSIRDQRMPTGSCETRKGDQP